MKWAASVAWLVGVASCGGIAIVDPPDDDSSGTTTPTTGGGDPLCAAACNALSVCGVEVASCTSSCLQVTPGCESVREPFLTCLAEETSDNCSTGLCRDETEDFIACLNVSAVGGSCGNNATTCACLHDDEYGNVYDYQCFGTNDFNCTCTLNGDEIGECSEGLNPCGFESSCCASLVFARGFP